MAADHRNGSGRQADQWGQPHGGSSANRNHILKHNQEDHQNQEHSQILPPLLQHLEICLKADRCKKEHHRNFPQRIIKINIHQIRHMQNGCKNRKHKAARNRCRNAERLQKLHTIAQPLSKEQHRHRNGKRLILIERNRHHSFPPREIPFSL